MSIEEEIAKEELLTKSEVLRVASYVRAKLRELGEEVKSGHSRESVEGNWGLTIYPRDIDAAVERVCGPVERDLDKAPPTGNCEICGEPMPPGEEMFKFHGYSGPCPELKEKK